MPRNGGSLDQQVGVEEKEAGPSQWPLDLELSVENCLMHGRSMVLVVEDDPQIQVLIEAALDQGGFDCVITASGEEAINLLQEEAGKYCALLTDINLSLAMDGWEAARRARKLKPDIPVLYMTGDSADQWASSGVPHSIILNKPFAPSQVAKVVAQLLNASAAPSPLVQGGGAWA